MSCYLDKDLSPKPVTLPPQPPLGCLGMLCGDASSLETNPSVWLVARLVAHNMGFPQTLIIDLNCQLDFILK